MSSLQLSNRRRIPGHLSPTSRPSCLVALVCTLTWALASCVEPDAPSATHDIVVSEFMADNTITLLDEDGDSSDWIELHNRTSVVVDLGGWALSDNRSDPRRWTFPAVTIGPGERLVVFASGKDRRTATNELHANFRLARTGEFLGLTDGNGTLVDGFGAVYPPQASDLSFGHTPSGGDGYMHPTPGGPNTETGWSGVVRPPTFVTDRTFVTESLEAELRAPTAGAVVRYTLDGSSPDHRSPIYDGPIALQKTTLVRARAHVQGLAPSDEVARTYLRIDDRLLAFDSDLPLVLAWTPERTMAQAFVPMHVEVVDRDPDGRSRVSSPRQLVADGAIARRGSTSFRWPKRSYKFELRDEVGRDEPSAILDLPADSDWILYGPYRFDRALMRNALIYELSNQIGRYAPRTRYVELFLSTGGDLLGPHYYQGLYSLVEKIKRAPDRVDVSPLRPRHDAEPEITGGYLLKIDRGDPGDQGLWAAGQTIWLVDPKEDEITPTQSAWLRSYLDDFGAALAADDFADPERGYARFIDADSWIDYHLLNELTRNPDGTRLSMYLHKPRGGRLAMGPVWDFDRAMQGDPVGWSAGRYLGWWGRLFEDPAFVARYARRWRELRAGGLATVVIHGTIDRLAREIAEAQRRNFERWPYQARERDRYEVEPGPDGWEVGQVDRLKDWLATRAVWMDDQLQDPVVPES